MSRRAAEHEERRMALETLLGDEGVVCPWCDCEALGAERANADGSGGTIYCDLCDRRFAYPLSAKAEKIARFRVARRVAYVKTLQTQDACPTHAKGGKALDGAAKGCELCALALAIGVEDAIVIMRATAKEIGLKF